MKRFLLLALLLVAFPAFATTIYFDDAVNDDWSNAGNWFQDATFLIPHSGAPLATDDVLFIAGSGACQVDLAAVCKSVDFTGYANTITFTASLTVSGNVTLEGTATYTPDDGSLIVNAASTITSDAESFAVPLNLGGNAGSFTITLADNWTTTGGVSVTGSSAAARVLTGNTLNVAGNFTISGITTGSVSGTTTIVMNGSGTVTSSLTTGARSNPFTINTAGNIVFSGQNNYGGASGAIFTYTTAASVTTTGSTLYLVGTATLATNGITWNDIQIGVSGAAGFTTTLQSDLNVAGDLLITGSTTAAHIISGVYNLNVAGDFTISGITTGSVSGTTTIVMNGTGVAKKSVCTFSNTFIIATAGTVSIGDVSTIFSCTTVSFVGTTGTINFVNDLETAGVTGTVIALSNTMSFSGTGKLICGNGGGIDGNGASIAVPFQLGYVTAGARTFTLLEDLTVTAGLTIIGGGNSAHAINGAYNLNVSGDFTVDDITTGSVTGTATIVLQGGTWSMPDITTGYLGLNTQIAGNVTISGNINVGGNGKGLTYVSGTEVTTNSNVVVKVGTYTITMSAAGFGFSGLRLQGNTTFAGTEGFSVKYLESAAGLSHVLKSAEEVTVSDSLKFVGTSGSTIALASSTPDAVAYLTFNGYRNQSLSYTNPTDINSSLGGFRGRIYDVGGVIDNSANWYPRNASMAMSGGGVMKWSGTANGGRKKWSVGAWGDR